MRYYDCVVTGAGAGFMKELYAATISNVMSQAPGGNIMDIDPISFLQQFVKRL